MPRATSVVRAANRQDAPILDTLILPYAQRLVHRGFLFGVKGTCVELDFSEPLRLFTDDALVLDGGGLVEIVVEAEPLIEVRMNDAAALTRLAWSLGDRHVPAQIFDRRLRLRRDPMIEEWLRGLGARLAEIEAPFEPEGAAAPSADHDHHHHDHGHDHHHDGHGHHDHDHGHHDHHGHDHHHHDHQRDHDHAHEPGHHSHHDHAPHRDKP